MCGIFGTYNINIRDEKANYCIDLMSHRGPNGRGIWRDSDVILGHRRLAVLDLSDKGSQPMIHDSGRYVIVYNGEIYNYVELREELIKKNYIFHSNCDTEVVLNSFIEWGENCNRKFNGMWAFAIWDRQEKKLFLSRDRFGVKPLYLYIKRNGTNPQIAFASEMKSLVPIIEKPEYNKKLLTGQNYILSYEATKECIIKQITRVKAGYYAWIGSEGIVETKWWNTCDNLIEVPQKYNEQVDMFRELFKSACKLRMRSDVTLGTALSGGLDSSSTLSMMAYIAQNKEIDIKQNWQNAYTAVFPGLPIDEQKYAKQVAKKSGTKCSYISISADDFLNNLEQDVYLFEELYITPPTPMIKIYKAMKSDGVTVTLDGHGADELFCGYSGDIAYAFGDAKMNIFQIRNIVQTYMGLFPIEKHYFESSENSKLDYYLKNLNLSQQTINNTKKSDRKIVNNANWNRLDCLNKQLYYETHYSVLPTLLRNYDRYSMANGVEIRMPFLDYRIVSFAFSIGWQCKLRNGYTKTIVRDSLKDILPRNIAYRKSKIGFSSPLLEWMRGPLKEFVLDTIASKDFSESSLTNKQRCEKKMKNILENKEATQYDAEGVWRELNPYFWERYFYAKLV